jgi:hypothetical protein
MDIEDRIKDSKKTIPACPDQSGSIYDKSSGYRPRLMIPKKPLIIGTTAFAVLAGGFGGWGIYAYIKGQQVPFSMDNLVIDGYKDYAAFGIGAKENKDGTSSSAKSRIRKRELSDSASAKEYTSSTPFIMVGQDNSKNTKDVSFKDTVGSYFTHDYTVSYFDSLDAFYAVTVSSLDEYKAANQVGNQKVTYKCDIFDTKDNESIKEKSFISAASGVLAFKHPNGANGLDANEYLISKNTGKIYNYGKKFLFFGYAGFNKGFYTIGYPADGTSSTLYYYRITEDTLHERLKIEQLFDTRAVNTDGACVDYYGNLYINGKFYTLANQTIATPALASGTAVTLKGNPINYYNRRFMFTDEMNYIYYLDDGASWVRYGKTFYDMEHAADLSKMKWVMTSGTDSYYVRMDYYDGTKTDTCVHTYVFDKLSFVDSIKYTCGTSYTFDIDLNSVLKDEPSYFYRNNYLYFYDGTSTDQNSHAFYKVDIINGSYSKIEISGYDIQSVTEDNLGNIVVGGFTTDLKPFTGYLTSDDKLTLTLGANAYSVIYIYSLN